MSRRPKGLVRRVDLACSASRAFAAVGTLAGIRGWWTPLVSGSARLGGELTLAFEGLDETIRFAVEHVEKPRHVRLRCLGHDSLEDWRDTCLAFTVEPRGEDESMLELVHEGLVPTLDCYASCRAGWKHFLDSLSAWCETGRGDPHRGSGRSTSRASTSRGKSARTSSRGASNPHAARLALIESYAEHPRVSLPRDDGGRFGGRGLSVDGKVFAMWVRDALVVKLPASEVDAAVAAGRGERLTMGAGRVMKEWLVVHEPASRWRGIAERARRFVGGA